MAPKMKGMKAMKPVVSMSKGAIAAALSEACEVKKPVAAAFLGALAELATGELKKAGKFTIPGLCMVKTKTKPATKAGKREMFGKVVSVKAKPAKTVVKAYPVAATSPWAARGLRSPSPLMRRSAAAGARPCT